MQSGMGVSPMDSLARSCHAMVTRARKRGPDCNPSLTYRVMIGSVLSAVRLRTRTKVSEPYSSEATLF